MATLDLYRSMARSRAYELAIARLWEQGLISGEMHLGTGEEAVCAGINAHLVEEDALALDHRSTPMLLMRGTDPAAIIRELLGREDGLCCGQGGHMHLFDPSRLAASSGIVGSAGPAAAGFALAAKRNGSGGIAVAFFGDGAVNQGMLMESMNLAVAWSLPVLFVCKNNRWAIGTESASVTGGAPAERARAFGLDVYEVDGLDVGAVAATAEKAIDRIRRRGRAAWIHASVARLDGHMLGDPILRLTENPIEEGMEAFGRVVKAALDPDGGRIGARVKGLASMMKSLALVGLDDRGGRRDPLTRARKTHAGKAAALDRIDEEVGREAEETINSVLDEGGRS